MENTLEERAWQINSLSGKIESERENALEKRREREREREREERAL